MTTQAFRDLRTIPFAAGLLAVTLCGLATALDGLLVVAGLAAVMAAAMLSYRHPSGMLLVVMAVSILVPVDLAPQMEPLPRLGPTRALLGAFLAGWLARVLMERLERRPPRLPLLGAWLLYLGATALSTMVSIEPMRSVLFSISLIVEQLLLFYIFARQASEPGFDRAFLTTVLAATIAVATGALYESLTQHNPIFLIYPWETVDYRMGLLRVRSTFFHPIALGTFVTLALPFLVVDAGTSRGIRRVVAAAAVALALVTSFLTFSRGPWLAQLLGLGLLVAWWTRGRPARVTAVVTLLAVVAGVALVLATTLAPIGEAVRVVLDPNRVSQGGLSEASSEYYRIALFEAVFDRLSRAEWLYGLGPGTFYLADVESTYAGHQHVLTAPDSQLAKLLLEQGLLGTASFLVLMAAAVTACSRAARRASPARAPLLVASLAAVSGFLVANLTVSMFFLLPLALLFWAAVGLAVARPRRSA